ncbi:PRC-barrel domain containing protein [Streptomyces sp. NBC_01233]|uniref:PRC-barrel domain containing protein n=1 Tax=Streptomyces sp. NBC_01233 TaxID=2903787 RepID=UPI002E15C614|nr:PRC-barrel domain containing protein [Streptomyces sp. NBC_01233]
MTEHVWSYRSTAGHVTGADLAGYKVEAIDGDIGRVDKHSYEVGDAYRVVDTGVWIFGKEVLLPASTVIRIDAAEKKVYVNGTKEQIKNAPEFHRDKHLGDVDYREALGAYYYSAGGPLGRRPV